MFHKTSKNQSNDSRTGQAFLCKSRISKKAIFKGPQNVKENNQQTQAKIKGFKEQTKAKIKCSKGAEKLIIESND